MSIDPYLDAQYDNRAKVPGHPAIMAEWARDAAASRATHANAERDLSYGETPRQTMDIFWPDEGRTAPLAMFIHGGYWQALSKDSFSHFARGLNAHGVAVAMPSYDLCPAVALATIVEQMREAAAFLGRRHGRGVFAMGHSAGGHLAAMLMASDFSARGCAGVRSGLSLSGLFDLSPLRRTRVNDGLRLDAGEALRLSPLSMPHPAGRLHAIVGSEEGPEYTRQSRAIAEAWNGSFAIAPGTHHFSVLDPLADPASALVETAVAMVHAGDDGL